ncbi:MAG: hypothetical protein AB8G17_19555 [Gammaproteobacteria bacterium]
MDTQTAFYIVSSPRGRTPRVTRQVSPFFESLNHAVRALRFMRDRLPRDEHLHIEHGDRPTDYDA